MDTWLIVVATAGGLSTLAVFWVKVLNPIARFISVSVLLADSIPIWQEIAAEFKPDHGSSLHDRMATADTQRDNASEVQSSITDQLCVIEGMFEANDRAHLKLFAEIAVVQNKLDVFIIDRQQNGRRKHDPHE